MGKSRKVNGSFRKITLLHKLLAWFLLVALVPLFVFGYVSYNHNVKSMKNEIAGNLNAITESKMVNIETYFKERKKDIITLAYTPAVTNGLEEISSVYINNGVYSPEYSAIDRKFRKFLTTHMEINDYYDLFLISPSGDIVFTVMHEDDFATNLRTGLYKETELAKSFNRTYTLLSSEISDFVYYKPSVGTAAFITMPVFKDRKFLGVIAAQMDIEQIYKLALDFTGLGETGETVIAIQYNRSANFIAPTRNNPYAIGKIIEFSSEEASPIQQAVQGISGAGESIDYRNREILAVWNYFPLMRWGIVVKIDTTEALAQVHNLTRWYILMGLIILTGVAIITLFVSRSISQPITKLTNTIELMADGDLAIRAEVKTNDEIGLLANSFNDMLDNLRLTLDKNEFQDWLKSGQMELSARMSGEHDIGTLGANIISYISEYLNSQVGTICMTDEDNRLKLIGSYSYTRRKGIVNEFKFGEGLAGQAALEKKPIIITSCPDDYISISSGLGDAMPNNIIVFPLITDNVVVGVIELGSFHKYSDNDITFLEQISGFIAIALSSINSRIKVNALLVQTQEQADNLQAQQEELKNANEELEEHIFALKESEERLQAQQEELKVSNEEMEEHTSNLKRSEESLQAQQEELQASNEELEAKTITLREQRNALDEKNRDIEAASIEIMQKAEELELANKYKSEFLASMSHELRTPLNSLLILAKLLQDNKSNNLTEKQIEFARTIHQSGNDLLTLINDILDLSKVEAGKLEVHWENINPSSWIMHMEQTFRHVADKNSLAFSVTSSENTPEMIISDSTRVAQILKNLLSNAFKFTSKGEVSLTVEKPMNGVQFTNNSLTTERTIAFKVSDTGIGLSEEKQKIIFDAFQQADSRTCKKYGGTGLGLSISRELAKLLGGELHLKSEEGKGSTFTLFLPISPPETEDVSGDTNEDEVAGSSVTPDIEVISSEPDKVVQVEIDGIPDDRRELVTGDKSVLMIDDDPVFLKILSELAHEKGFKALTAGNGHTGLHMADYYRPSAIILDIKMPEMNGFDVMKRLKENPRTRYIPVHFVSGVDRTEEVLKSGAIGLLMKPVSTEDIELCFEKFEKLIETSIKSVLIVEDNTRQQESLMALLEEKDVTSTAIKTGEKAIEILKKDKFDCLILDLGLAGKMTGFELADMIKNDDTIPHVPIIIYTGKDLSSEEEIMLKKRSDCIIIKGVHSPDRLKDEVNLFLHKVEDELPMQHKKALKAIYSKDESLSGKKVLIVDDDMRNVFALSSAIQDQGMSVIVGKNGREGIDQLVADPDVNIVLMDIMMPELDGYEAMKEIRLKDKFKDLPIIALTAKAMKGEKERCVEAGASDYLSKPVDTERLLSLMRVWVHQK